MSDGTVQPKLGPAPTLAARTALILELEKEGKTLQQIGDTFGLTRERVRQVLKRHGVVRSIDRKKPELNDAALVYSGLEGMTEHALRKKFGQKAVRWMREHRPDRWDWFLLISQKQRSAKAHVERRARCVQRYRAKCVELGVSRLTARQIGKCISNNTLSQVYGPGYLKKFRAELGE